MPAYDSSHGGDQVGDVRPCVDALLTRRKGDFPRKDCDDTKIHQREIAEQLSRDQPQTEVVLSYPPEKKRREPQTDHDDRRLMQVSDCSRADDSPCATQRRPMNGAASPSPLTDSAAP